MAYDDQQHWREKNWVTYKQCNAYTQLCTDNIYNNAVSVDTESLEVCRRAKSKLWSPAPPLSAQLSASELYMSTVNLWSMSFVTRNSWQHPGVCDKCHLIFTVASNIERVMRLRVFVLTVLTTENVLSTTAWLYGTDKHEKQYSAKSRKGCSFAELVCRKTRPEGYWIIWNHSIKDGFFCQVDLNYLPVLFLNRVHVTNKMLKRQTDEGKTRLRQHFIRMQCT